MSKAEFESISRLQPDQHGILVANNIKPQGCSLEGFKQLDRLETGEDLRNYLHLFRMMLAYRFVTSNAKQGSVVADIGAGYCEMTKFFATAGCKFDYYAFEADRSKLVSAAKMKVGSFKRRLIQIDLSLGRVPLPDNSVDVLLCLEFAEHIPRSCFISLLSDLNRICKNGAPALFTTPNCMGGGVPNADHVYEYTHTEFESLLAAAGFKVVDAFGIASKHNINAIDKTSLAANDFYRNMRKLLPPAFVKPLLIMSDESHRKDCKEQAVFCVNSGRYDATAVSKVSFADSESINQTRSNDTRTMQDRIGAATVTRRVLA